MALLFYFPLDVALERCDTSIFFPLGLVLEGRGTSILFSYRCGTGEAWHLVMKDCFDDAPCFDSDKSCGNTNAAIIYFCSFYFLCAFLVSGRYLDFGLIVMQSC